MSESMPEAGDVEVEQMLAKAVAEPEQSDEQGHGQEQSDTDVQKAQQAKDWESEAAKWRSLARKHETTAKANADAARKYAEWEESQKTEQQKLLDRLEAAERSRDEISRTHARMIAAATHNIPASLLERIGGSTEEEIEESAAALAAEIDAAVAARLAEMPPPSAPAPAAPAPTRPVESLTPGAMPASSQPLDGNDFIRWMAGRTP